VGTARSDVPTANSMPRKVAPSGTGALPVPVSGPEMPAYALPSRSQNTRPQHTAATEVISATCSLVQVHTVSTHGESDARVSNPSATGEGYALRRPAAFVPHDEQSDRDRRSVLTDRSEDSLRKLAAGDTRDAGRCDSQER
jgi:hypothetical protein